MVLIAVLLGQALRLGFDGKLLASGLTILGALGGFFGGRWYVGKR